MKKWKKLVHRVIIMPLLLGCVSLSADPKRVFVFGSDPAGENPAGGSDEYYYISERALGEVLPGAFFETLDLMIGANKVSRDTMIEFIKACGETSDGLLEIQKRQDEQIQDDKLAQMLNEAKSKGAGVEDIKAIILKEASSCKLGEKLSLSLQGLGTEPNMADTRRKLKQHHYTFASKPSDPPDPLQSNFLRAFPYPIDYIPCTIGTGEFLKLVQERGGRFDYIYTCSCSLYEENSLEVIEELILTLNPGGKLYICSEANPAYPNLITQLRPSPTPTEVHFAGEKATVIVREADYYTLTPPEREELDNVVLWSSRAEENWPEFVKGPQKRMWRKPLNPSIIHHFQGRKGTILECEKEIIDEKYIDEKGNVDETSKPLLIVTRHG
ncbi:MAG: class I SAM-dependent methyltransferase [Puniceicoccales bacterium]|jgi:SAM-dependent methyltransferase|nr:class I SAM-dependent methyltransferase [Puniceicoccales bacterium]